MEKLIRQWATDRDLDKSHPMTQLAKVMEELGELSETLTKRKGIEQAKDDIGDVYITLVILAQILGTTVEEASKIAYNEIKDRQGVTVNGTFIKSDDLEEYRQNN